MMVLRFGPFGASFVKLSVHGRPYVFSVDTGAARTVITNRAAAALGLPKRGRSFAVGVIGCKATSQAVSVSKWSLGGVRLDPMTILSQALSTGPDVDGMKVSGLLGFDVLRRLGAVTFDFASHRLTLGGSPGPGPSIAIRMHRVRGGIFFESVRTMIKRRSVTWLIDTGSTGAVISQHAATEIGLRPIARSVMIHGATGCTIRAAPVVIKAWSAGPVALPQTVALASSSVHTGKVDGTRIAGSIGLDTLLAFKKITLDFATSRLILDDPK